jgi:deoxyribodipyrimidine photo-lyase
MSQKERVKFLNDRAVPPGRPVVYWMQASLRTGYNHPLEYAIHLANHRRCGIHVVFCLTPSYPGATVRHYTFLLEGIRDVAGKLKQRGIPFSLWTGDPMNMAAALRGLASTIVTDRGYLRHQRRWRESLATDADCPVVQVESNVVVPVELVSGKEEYSAATIRPRILRHRDGWILPVQEVEPQRREDGPLLPNPASGVAYMDIPEHASWGQADAIPEGMEVLREPVFTGGESAARHLLDDFLQNRLSGYDTQRNIPDKNHLSHMSPYLHFGNISPVEIALKAMEYAQNVLEPDVQGSLDTLLEELIVRRELAMNYAEYNPRYDSYGALPEWARRSLEEHATDPRPYVYTLEELTAARTADPYWNACQREMVITGKMHGYMRMYWGKKVIEWTPDPEEAFQRLIFLNDTYELDGRDPNGYAGVAWVFGKHDRPWVERPIFGKVRYMNDNGLRRKFKEIDLYVRRWTS